MKNLLQSTILAGIIVSTPAMAARSPYSAPADHRIRYVSYHEADVVNVEGNYSYSTSIEFGDNEEVETISIGDSESWQVVAPPTQPNMLFIKPLLAKAYTNMNVVTNQRIYSFSLSTSSERKVIPNNPRLTYRIKFKYPSQIDQALKHDGFIDLTKRRKPVTIQSSTVAPHDLNFEYSFSGDDTLRPIQTFDNGKFTYFHFADSLPTPAIFTVDSSGNESLVNFVKKGKYIVVETLSPQFTLRAGKNAVSCIFNEEMPHSDTSTTLKDRDTADSKPVDNIFDKLQEFEISSIFNGKIEYTYPNSVQ